MLTVNILLDMYSRNCKKTWDKSKEREEVRKEKISSTLTIKTETTLMSFRRIKAYCETCKLSAYLWDYWGKLFVLPFCSCFFFEKEKCSFGMWISIQTQNISHERNFEWKNTNNLKHLILLRTGMNYVRFAPEHPIMQSPKFCCLPPKKKKKKKRREWGGRGRREGGRERGRGGRRGSSSSSSITNEVHEIQVNSGVGSGAQRRKLVAWSVSQHDD